MKRIFLLFILATFLYSCDVVSPTKNYYIADTITNSSNEDEVNVVKKVLLIDFTAIQCFNCPKAHEIIHQVQNVYPNKVVAVAIHGTSLAYPMGEFKVNLMTPDGNAICSELDPGSLGLPIGLVDKYNKNNLAASTSWADVVSNNVNEAPQFDIQINNSFDDATKKLDISIDLISQIKTDKALKLVVFITEDHIITRQATHEEPGYIEEYEQMHVFRDAVSNIWGDPIFADGVEVNKKETVEFSCTFDDKWKAENANVVAFVIDDEANVLNAQEKVVK